MAVRAHVHRDVVDVGGEVRAVIEVEPAEEVLVRLAAAGVLRRDQAGYDFEQFRHSQQWSHRQIGAADRAFARRIRGTDQSLAACKNDDLFQHLTVASGTARLMALANIRHADTVEGLLSAGKKVGGAGGRGLRNEVIEALRPVYRAVLVILTGHDEGPGAGLAWEKWWKDEGKKRGVSAERPPVPDEVRKLWETFWHEPYGTAEAAPGDPLPTGWSGVTLACTVDTRDEVDRAYTAAVTAGATPVAAATDRPWGGRSAFIADPEGNRWEITWGPGATFDERGALLTWG